MTREDYESEIRYLREKASKLEELSRLVNDPKLAAQLVESAAEMAGRADRVAQRLQQIPDA